MNERDLDVSLSMQRYGGDFARKLGELLQLADTENLAKLKLAFSEYYKEYEDMAVLARERAEAGHET